MEDGKVSLNIRSTIVTRTVNPRIKFHGDTGQNKLIYLAESLKLLEGLKIGKPTNLGRLLQLISNSGLEA